ncbi:MAG: RadC family protein [Pseudomonadota bacterium]
MAEPGQDEKPHYLGHRQRLRERFRKDAGQAFPDYELLELLLCAAIPRHDLKPLAKTLIRRFGSFAAAISAERAALLAEKGMSETAVDLLHAVREAAVRLARAEIMGRPVLGSWQKVLDYCRTELAHAGVEEFRVLFLDRKNALIDDIPLGKGTVDHTPVYPREVVKRALELGASAIIMVHNHPSGDPAPSKADIDMTREVVKAAGAVGIALHDHIVIGRHGHASFKTLGLL